jgi:Flp pilus assembly CpaE family ATPase
VERIGNPHIELVVNRFDARKTEFNDERVAKALGVPPKWKIPNDYAAVHRSLNSGSPLIMEKSPVAQALRAMARAASGRPRVEGKKKSWGLFN